MPAIPTRLSDLEKKSYGLLPNFVLQCTNIDPTDQLLVHRTWAHGQYSLKQARDLLNEQAPLALVHRLLDEADMDLRCVAALQLSYQLYDALWKLGREIMSDQRDQYNELKRAVNHVLDLLRAESAELSAINEAESALSRIQKEVEELAKQLSA